MRSKNGLRGGFRLIKQNNFEQNAMDALRRFERFLIELEAGKVIKHDIEHNDGSND
jgi:hypothetical protein